MKRRYLFILIILIILTFGIGVLRNYITERSKITEELPKEIKPKERPSFLPVQGQEKVFTLSGEIVEIRGNEIILRIIVHLPPEFKETETEMKKIIVTEETEILKESAKVEKEEIEGTSFFFPIFQLEPTELKDLKVGDQISVTSKEDMEEKEEIIASQIIVSEVE